MASNELGKQGEAVAKQYLLDHGYAIVETNWRLGRNELDIVAHAEGFWVFVEVKARATRLFGNPQEAVDFKKRSIYRKLANAYIIQHRIREEVRFDIIAIVFNDDGSHELEHIENAFSIYE